ICSRSRRQLRAPAATVSVSTSRSRFVPPSYTSAPVRVKIVTPATVRWLICRSEGISRPFLTCQSSAYILSIRLVNGCAKGSRVFLQNYEEFRINPLILQLRYHSIPVGVLDRHGRCTNHSGPPMPPPPFSQGATK